MRVDTTVPIGRLIVRAYNRGTGRTVLCVEREVYTKAVLLSEALLDMQRAAESVVVQLSEEVVVEVGFVPNY